MGNEKENQRFTWENRIIKGFPELKWTGKKPYTSTEYFPAQKKEVYGDPDSTGWLNKIFWGDNLQVIHSFTQSIDCVKIGKKTQRRKSYRSTGTATMLSMSATY